MDRLRPLGVRVCSRQSRTFHGPLPATRPATDIDTPEGPRLASLIDAWDALPEAVRAGIATMVVAARTSSVAS